MLGLPGTLRSPRLRTLPVHPEHAPAPNQNARDLVKVLLVMGSILVLAVIAWFVFRAWYIDTHCTMILGTRICQS